MIKNIGCTGCLLAVFFLFGISMADAQVAQTPEKRQELLRKVLKEKGFMLTAPESEAEEGTRTAAKTTATDQRITTYGASVDEGEISIAVDPTDSNNLVLSFMQQAGGLSFPIFYSTNGGATWGLSNFSSDAIRSADFPGQLAAGGGDPAFAWDRTGRLYYAWIYLTLNSAHDTAFFTLNWAYSTDKGHTWSVAANHFIGQGAIDPASNNNYPYKDGITDREWLAVDNSTGPHHGNVYCSFVNFPANPSAPSFEGIKTMVPGTDTFGPLVPAYTGSTQFGNVEVDNNGVLHMSFADLDNSAVRHAASHDGGVSFGPAQVVANTGIMFPSAPFVVHNRENGAINMACDGPAGTGNNVHVVWSDFPGGTVNSYYSHSTDGGITWSAPDTLNNLFGGHTTLMPTVAASGNNIAISVTVVDSLDSARYYQLYSLDNGQTFLDPQLLSSAPTNYVAIGAPAANSGMFFGDYNRSVRTNCTTYASWEDGRNHLGPKVYFARKNYCTLGLNEITSVTSPVQLLSVFPNPASDFLTLRLSAVRSEALTVSITSLTGKVLMSKSNEIVSGAQQVTLALPQLPVGIYLLSLRDNDGVIATRSFVVK